MVSNSAPGGETTGANPVTLIKFPRHQVGEKPKQPTQVVCVSVVNKIEIAALWIRP